ncbi:MAG: hypothetical protein A2176_04150 [Spirochaetes bacterium RBG_13_51_14]|nr:MAG: hypothetical protein A2176_04150 [Spirochaetes bacterium RBG_13_51_14]
MFMETKTKIFGMPVFSFGFAAKGFIAVGFAGRGVITIAQFGYGFIAITQFGFGVVSISQFGFGLIAVAQGALGILVAIGQGALGFIAAGLNAKGYYSMSGPGVWRNVPVVLDQAISNPAPLIVWASIWAVIFLFFWSQRDKFSLKMSRDLFRSRKKHRDDRIRARAVSNLTDQDELLRIILNDPSDYVKTTAIKNITDPDKRVRIAKATRSEEVAGIIVAVISDPDALFDIARDAILPSVKIAAAVKLARADPSRLTALACSEIDKGVIEGIIECITDQDALETIIRTAASPHAKTRAIYNLEKPGQEFLYSIVKSEADISVCQSAVYRISDTRILSEIIHGDYHSTVKTAAVERIEDKQLLTEFSRTDLPGAVLSAIDHRLNEIRPVYHSLKIEFICPYCSQPVFVNAPLRKTTCQSCLRETAIAGTIWKGIRDAGFGVTRFTSPLNLTVEKTRSTPFCGTCREPLLTDEVPNGSKKPVKCGSCGAEQTSCPVPGWLRWSKYAEQVFCTEEDGATAPGEKDIKPVAVSCIKCGAPLEITAATPRNATCRYCNTVQYLPDPLWHSLHPVKIKHAWYIRNSFKERS